MKHSNDHFKWIPFGWLLESFTITMRSHTVKMARKRKKQDNTMAIVVVVLAVTILAMVGLTMFSASGTGSGMVGGSNNDGQVVTVGNFDYSNSLVNHNLKSEWFYNGSSADATFYVYATNENGEAIDRSGNTVDVENFATSSPSGYVDTGVASSGSYQISEEPGTYIVRAELSNGYSMAKEVVVPSSGDVALTDYNSAPQTDRFKFKQFDSLSLSNWDLGVTGSETAGDTVFKSQAISVASDKSYYLSEIKLQEDATYSFATDSDGDNTYDEGVSKIDVFVNGVRYTVYDKGASIDEFSGDDTASIQLDTPLMLDERESFTIDVEVTSEGFSNTTGTADEKLGDGEDIIDKLILIDTQGNTANAVVQGWGRNLFLLFYRLGGVLRFESLTVF